MACVNTSVALKVKINIVRNEAVALEQRSARDLDRVPENCKSPGQSRIVKSRNSASRSQSRIPDFRILSPCPGRGSRIFWFRVPVPVPDFLGLPARPGCPFRPAHPGQSRFRSRIFSRVPFPVPVRNPADFKFEFRYQSRILLWVPVPVPVPYFRDRDRRIPGTLTRIPTPALERLTLKYFI